MKEFNLDFLGKWCWRMLVDRNGLSYRVLVARYGEEDGVLKEGGGKLQVGGVSSRTCVMVVGEWEESGLETVLQKWWGMGGILIFGLIRG